MSRTVQRIRLAHRATRKAPARATATMSRVEEKEDVVDLLGFYAGVRL
jgi:hypothetical protein